MKQSEFDTNVSLVLAAFRVIARQKQANVAALLNIHQSEYSRIEQGERALTMGQVKEICDFLEISIVQVIMFAEARMIINFKLTPLSIVLTQLLAIIEKEEGCKFSISDLELILNRVAKKKGKLNRL